MEHQEATNDRPWDHSSSLRERLALLAAIGPALDPRTWSYHYSRDVWYYCGEDTRASGSDYVTIRHNGSVSLALIAVKWQLNWAAAMALVGYPDPADVFQRRPAAKVSTT
jgi:hypothetical protein